MKTLIPELFWFSFCLCQFVKLNELKPIKLSAKVVKQEEDWNRLAQQLSLVSDTVEDRWSDAGKLVELSKVQAKLA